MLQLLVPSIGEIWYDHHGYKPWSYQGDKESSEKTDQTGILYLRMVVNLSFMRQL